MVDLVFTTKFYVLLHRTVITAQVPNGATTLLCKEPSIILPSKPVKSIC